MAGSRTVAGADRLLRRFYESAAAARDRGLSRRLIEDASLEGNFITLDGARLANFTSCSYLGLGTDDRLRRAAVDAVARYGTSYSSSIAYTAVPLYGALRERVVAILGAPVVLAPTTTLAHLTALPILARKGDIVLIDAFAHASVHMATGLLAATGIPVRTLPHNDGAALEEAIETAEAETPGRVWYLCDGVYSMHGDVAPLDLVHRLLDGHPRLHAYVDDAHGFSWQGLHGCGVALDAAGWHPRLVLAVGFAKSFGTVGAAVASPDPDLVDLVEVCGGPLTFGGPIVPAALGAGVASAEIHLSDEHPSLRQDLLGKIALVNEVAADLAIPMGPPTVSPIRFVEVGSTTAMFDVIAGLKADGFYLSGAMFPAVPQGRAGVRFTVTRCAPDGQIEEMLRRLRHHLSRVASRDVVIDLRGDEPAVGDEGATAAQ